MASPPNPATSPPYAQQTSLPNPKKRPSLPLPQSSANFKRRKPSVATSATSASAHPLRQTSFPPEELIGGGLRHDGLRDLRSPSVESSVAGTSVTGGGGGGGGASSTRGRGRPRKSGGRARKDEDGRSVKSGTGKGGTGTRAGSILDGKSATGGAGGGGDEGGEAEDEEGDDEMATAVEGGGEVERAAEKKKMAVLVDAFDRDQQDRYDMYRRVKLKKETVRKLKLQTRLTAKQITNATLSQSVPPSVITTINGYTKIFIGELIEKARQVQAQYALAESLTPPDSPPTTTNGASSSHPQPHQHPAPVKEPPGPLLPDHLREALRRYKRDGEGGGAGFAGLSLGLGVQGVGSARLGGRRLFR
ncbi:MAG: hypothetical protein M1830_002581 [Pleopsidium flavum]|nr:MAG: hypothetical protein M1830_002581 [Pleopsidium flavum]